MRRSKLVCCSILAALALAGGVRAAYAMGFVSNGGNACIGNNPSIRRWEQGIYNESGTAYAGALCPLTLGLTSVSAVNYDTMNVRLRDYSSTAAFWCFVYEAFSDGSIYYSTTRYSCATPGGCTSWTTNDTGIGYIQWNNPQLQATQWQYVGANQGIQCVLPPWGAAESYVVGYEGVTYN